MYCLYSMFTVSTNNTVVLLSLLRFCCCVKRDIHILYTSTVLLLIYCTYSFTITVQTVFERRAVQYSGVVVVVAVVVDLYCLYIMCATGTYNTVLLLLLLLLLTCTACKGRFVVVVDVLTLQHVKCRTHVVDVDLYCLYSVCTAGTYNTVVL